MIVMRMLPKIVSYALIPAIFVAVVATSWLNGPTYGPDEARVNSAAPEFTLEGSDGEAYALSDFAGQYVVLEWLNFGCPYVRKHYDSGNMQRLQQDAADRGVVWFSVVSSAPGQQGYYPADEMNDQNAKRNGAQAAILLDPTGEVGRMYGAQTTPHMYVINPEGTLIYKGGIDDKATTRVADIETATNYVVAALDEAMGGKQVSVSAAPPYGCNVKYASN